MGNRIFKYALVSAAFNEEQFIEKVILSVRSQTHPPASWIIVSDGSTDRTDEIVRRHQEALPFIKLVRIDKEHPRDFAAQIAAINVGLSLCAEGDVDFIGNLDCDVTFDYRYFELLLQKFESDPRLGLAGGCICEVRRGGFVPRPTNSFDSVAHAVQLFRRECFDVVKPYEVLPYGGADWHANVSSRIAGWTVRSFDDLPVYHHRPFGSSGRWVRSAFRQGLMDWSLGSHPGFECLRVARRLLSRPFVLYSTTRFAGFIYGYCCGKPRTVQGEFVTALRAEEFARLRSLLPFCK